MRVQILLGCEWLQHTSLAFSMSYLQFDRIINQHTTELKVHSQILETENLNLGKPGVYCIHLGRSFFPEAERWRLIKQSTG